MHWSVGQLKASVRAHTNHTNIKELVATVASRACVSAKKLRLNTPRRLQPMDNSYLLACPRGYNFLYHQVAVGERGNWETHDCGYTHFFFDQSCYYLHFLSRIRQIKRQSECILSPTSSSADSTAKKTSKGPTSAGGLPQPGHRCSLTNAEWSHIAFPDIVV